MLNTDYCTKQEDYSQRHNSTNIRDSYCKYMYTNFYYTISVFKGNVTLCCFWNFVIIVTQWFKTQNKSQQAFSFYFRMNLSGNFRGEWCL